MALRAPQRKFLRFMKNASTSHKYCNSQVLQLFSLYYESGNSWQWEFLEVCWKFPGKFTDFPCFVA